MKLRETCLGYFKRRLKEGWKVISLRGYNAILQSPEGAIKELDLRHDVLTLRPNGAGDSAQNAPYPDSGEANWEDVDEEVADDDTTYVKANSGETDDDLYAIPTTSLSGTINSVTIYTRVKEEQGNSAEAWALLKTHATVYTGNGHLDDSDWTTHSDVWTTNPNTGSAWTWDEINALQIGIRLYTDNGLSLSIIHSTKVKTIDGYKTIENIKVGDILLSYDIKNKFLTQAKVIKTEQHEGKEYIVINDTLKLTPEHLVFVNGKFISAGQAKIGDILINEYGKEEKVKTIKTIKDNVKTYDLQLDKYHVFFAGNCLVHNIVTPALCTQVYAEVDYTAGGGSPADNAIMFGMNF